MGANHGAETISIGGTITKGLGQGAIFMSMAHYKNEIKKKLGFDSYPGTLNLKVDKKQIDLLRHIGSIKINEFKKNGKMFGGAGCYKAKIKGISGAIIVPDATRHKNVIEFVAPVHLKSELKLKDGNKIKIELIK